MSGETATTLPCGCPAVSPAYPCDYPLGHPHWECLRREDEEYARQHGEAWDIRQSWPGGRTYEQWQAADPWPSEEERSGDEAAH